MDANAQVLGRLTEVLERMWIEPRATINPPIRQFKAPQFDRNGDVEYFIRQFLEIAEANEWAAAAARLHLREALKETARDCGKPDTLDGIFAALRARFGLTNREARARLAALKREHKTSLQEHASEMERLVTIASADPPAHF